MNASPTPDSQPNDAWAEITDLAGSLAHEIRNPLSVIRLNVELLEEDLEEVKSAESRRALNKIRVVKSQCTRLEHLLDDFLQFSRLNKLVLSAGDLNKQVEQVLDFYSAEAKQQEVEIVRYLDADLPHIMMDSRTLQAALVNLIKTRSKRCLMEVGSKYVVVQL